MKRARCILYLLLPFMVGMISAAISSERMTAYESMMKPAFSPPAWVFPVAWTILYLMMGLASCLILAAKTDQGSKMIALLLYFIQLAMNFFWPIIFFCWEMYLWAFLWLIIMWGIVLSCVLRFFRIRRIAGYLMVPYVMWLTFAAYLNMGVLLLN